MLCSLEYVRGRWTVQRRRGRAPMRDSATDPGELSRGLSTRAPPLALSERNERSMHPLASLAGCEGLSLL